MRRFRLALGLSVAAVTGTGAAFAGWLSSDALTPEHTLQTATLHVRPVAARTVVTLPSADTTEADVEAAKNGRTTASSLDTLTPAEVRSLAAARAATALREAEAAEAAERAADTDAAERGSRLSGGVASYYGPGFHGRRTASGERFDQHGLTAAHRTLPFGTRLRVTNPANGRTVVVRVNDRGPFSRGRVLDLSTGAARAIGLVARGHGRVEIERLGPASRRERRRVRTDEPSRVPATPVVDSTQG